MIKSSGFKTYRPRPSRFIRFHTWLGGHVSRQDWAPMIFSWASVANLYTRDEILAGNRRFRESQLGWRSYMGKASARRL